MPAGFSGLFCIDIYTGEYQVWACVTQRIFSFFANGCYKST